MKEFFKLISAIAEFIVLTAVCAFLVLVIIETAKSII